MYIGITVPVFTLNALAYEWSTLFYRGGRCAKMSIVMSDMSQPPLKNTSVQDLLNIDNVSVLYCDKCKSRLRLLLLKAIARRSLSSSEFLVRWYNGGY